MILHIDRGCRNRSLEQALAAEVHIKIFQAQYAGHSARIALNAAANRVSRQVLAIGEGDRNRSAGINRVQFTEASNASRN